MSISETIAMLAAALFAGAVNSIAGGGTLLTFPTLVWLGFDARVANATSTVALWPGSMGAAWGYRQELSESRRVLRRLALPSLLGGGVGALLVLVTPSHTFERIVPYLILFATVLFILQDPIQRRLRSSVEAADPPRRWIFAALLLQSATSVYGGYFGAGMGILLLTVLGLLGVRDIHRANGLKNILGMLINGVAAVGFALSGLVSLREALLMALTSIVGGYGGARIAQRLGRTFVRRAVVLVGITIGVIMLVQTSR
jgi:uncharacterized membrane protein YfcA